MATATENLSICGACPQNKGGYCNKDPHGRAVVMLATLGRCQLNKLSVLSPELPRQEIPKGLTPQRVRWEIRLGGCCEESKEDNEE